MVDRRDRNRDSFAGERAVKGKPRQKRAAPERRSADFRSPLFEETWEIYRKMNGQDLLKAIVSAVAQQEEAVAALIRAETRKVEAFTGRKGDFPLMPTNRQINEFQTALARVIEALAQKQHLLLRTLEVSKRLLDETGR